MTFQPVKDRILVLPCDPPEKTHAGLFIPDKAQEKPQEGIVVAIGKNIEAVKLVDKVLYEKFSGTKFMLDGVEHIILKEDDLLGVLTGGE